MKKINLGNVQKIHFIGICGISMSGLAELLMLDGYCVTGSDAKVSDISDHLQGIGIPVAIPNAAQNIPNDTDLVVFTAAIRVDNPEYQAAIAMGKHMLERAALLGKILQAYDNVVCVAGTHGKTTATSMMAEVCEDAGLDPTISIGGFMARDNTNYRIGNSPYFVLEACEYNNSFHHWYPQVGIILNIDEDHLDFHGNFDGVKRAYRRFAENIPKGGVLVIQAGTPGFDIVTQNLPCRVVTFGENAQYHAQNISYDEHGCASAEFFHGKNKLANVFVALPGRFNLQNALAVFAAAIELGIAPEVAAMSLGGLSGVKRRFERKGEYNGAVIIDDYAHHPTEIIECLAAARNATKGKLYAIFQPHTYTRTKNLLAEFAACFAKADHVALLPIFPAREPFDASISSLHLQQEMLRYKCNVFHFDAFSDAAKFYRTRLLPEDMLITVGAGDVYIVGEQVLEI